MAWFDVDPLSRENFNQGLMELHGKEATSFNSNDERLIELALGFIDQKIISLVTERPSLALD